ncbi:MAG TPA: radical SAM protein, partial [Polyangia bacterium]
LKIVAGGLTAMARARQILLDHPAVDVVVRGEGEVPLAALVERDFAALDEIPGLTYRQGGLIVENGGPFFFDDLGRVPSPLTAGTVSLAEIPPEIGAPIEIGRGCPNTCAYCSYRDRPGYRLFPLQRIRADLAWAKAHGISTISLLSAAVDPSAPSFRRLVDEIRAIYGDEEFRLVVSIERDCQRPEVFEQVRDLPFFRFMFGLQTTNPQSLKRIGRPRPDLARFGAALQVASQIAQTQVDVMYGLPGDSFAGLQETMGWLYGLNRETPEAVGMILACWTVAAPGTPLGDRPESFGIRRLATPGIPYVLETDTYSFDDLIRSIDYLYAEREHAPIMMFDGDVPRHLPPTRDRVAPPRATGGRGGPPVPQHCLEPGTDAGRRRA